MKTVVYNGRIILPDEILENGYVVFEKGKITDVGLKIDVENFDGKRIDAKGNYVSPGFIDIHCHGGGGYRFVDATKEAVEGIAAVHVKGGTTTLFPTLSSFDRETMIKVIENIKEYKESGKAPLNIEGVHMEGPYLSLRQVGGMKTNNLRNPLESEYKNIIEGFGSFIKRWSYAPENEGAVEFQKYLQKNNILGAIAHSDATYEEIMEVYPYGLKAVTHLYSCTSTVTRKGGFRHLGIIETAFLTDDIYVEVIADGCHLPPELLKMIYKIKGDKKICLVTDATRYGGMDEKTDTGKRGDETDFIIEDGVAKLHDRSAFVGSIATADRLIRTCVKMADIPLLSAVRMMTLTPAELFNLKEKGKISAGYDADVVIFDDDITVKKVIVGGKEI